MLLLLALLLLLVGSIDPSSSVEDKIIPLSSSSIAARTTRESVARVGDGKPRESRNDQVVVGTTMDSQHPNDEVTSTIVMKHKPPEPHDVDQTKEGELWMMTRTPSHVSLRGSHNQKHHQPQRRQVTQLQDNSTANKPPKVPTIPIPTCRATNTFQTTYLIAVENINRTLISEEQLQLVATIFLETYNNPTTTQPTNDTTLCDPFFRSIVTVQASTDVTFVGSSPDGRLLANPLPIRPVRRRHRRRLNESGRDGTFQEEFSNSWKKVGIADRHGRILQGSASDGDGIGSFNSNDKDGTITVMSERNDRDTTDHPLGVILLNVTGTCRNCEVDMDLFDDVSDLLRQRRQLQPQPDSSDSSDDTTHCVCPTNSVPIVDEVQFGENFQEKIDIVQEAGEIAFFEQVKAVFGVTTQSCPTEEIPFASVYVVAGFPFNIQLLSSSNNITINQITHLFRDSYNGIAQQLCDPKYRSLSSVQLVSIVDSLEDPNTGGEPMVTMEFLAEGTCRDCTETQCLFDDDASACRTNRHLVQLENDPTNSFLHDTAKDRTGDGGKDNNDHHLEDHYKGDKPIRAADTKGGSNISVRIQQTSQFEKYRTVSPSNTLVHDIDKATPNSRYAKEHVEKDHHARQERSQYQRTRLLNQQEIGQCACRRSRSERAPTTVEFQTVFQHGLDELTENAKVIDSSCIVTGNGQLPSECECTSPTQCLTGRCTPTSSAFGDPGVCAPKITTTCNEPCVLPSDCASGVCGSIVCLPGDGTLLANGCLTNLDNECQSGTSQGSICVQPLT